MLEFCTNLQLVKFVAILCMVCVCFFFVDVSKKKKVAKKYSKCLRFDDKLFRSRDAFEAHTNFFSSAVIIVEREVNLDSLSQSFILEVFKDRTWTKLLNRSTNVWDPVI